ncbi:hypothetical protein JOE11_001999 [Robbsia andropogonis]
MRSMLDKARMIAQSFVAFAGACRLSDDVYFRSTKVAPRVRRLEIVYVTSSKYPVCCDIGR